MPEPFGGVVFTAFHPPKADGDLEQINNDGQSGACRHAHLTKQAQTLENQRAGDKQDQLIG